MNNAIVLSAVLFPLQTAKVQESILEQLSSFVSSTSGQRDPAREAAVTVNAAAALLAISKVANKETLASPGDIKSPAIETILQELLRVRPSDFCFLLS